MFPLTIIVRQETLSHLRGKCRTLVYQFLIDCRAIHGEIVGLDHTVVVCHGDVMDPFEVWGDGVVCRVTEGVFGTGLLFGWFETGGGVGVTARKDLEISL